MCVFENKQLMSFQKLLQRSVSSLPWKDIFSLILFTVKNKHLFISNKEMQNYKTRNKANLHLPTVNITKFYKGPYISGSKAFNHLPRRIKILANDMKCFKLSLKRFLYHHSFYLIEEYNEHNEDNGHVKTYYMNCDFLSYLLYSFIQFF